MSEGLAASSVQVYENKIWGNRNITKTEDMLIIFTKVYTQDVLKWIGIQNGAG